MISEQQCALVGGDRVEVEPRCAEGLNAAPGGPGTVLEIYGPGRWSGREVAVVELDRAKLRRVVDVELVHPITVGAGA